MPDRRPLLMLIDGPSLVYRGYFALPPLTLSDGMLVNAVFGFLQIVLRGMQDVKPDYAMVSFDIGKPQFRFDAYPDYKKGRPSMPDDLRAQFPIVREIAGMMNIPIRELTGYEADDVIGTLTKRATAEGVDTMIVSGDLDGLQLVDDHVRLLTTRMGVAATVIYDEARVMERYGLRPDQMLDYKALKGDTSDNIPGVPGVGEKTASSLLQQFGTLDGIYEHLDEVKGKMRDRLDEHRESAFMSREVGRIVIDLPVELDLEEARTGRYDRRAVAQRFRELEFRSLIDRLPASSIAPTGYDSPEAETKGGLQLSLDLLGGKPAPADGAAPPPVRPDPLADPGGAIEHIDPRFVRTAAEMAELEAWLEAHGDEIGLGWALGSGRPLERHLLGLALAGADGSSWYLPCDRASVAAERLPAWFGREDRRRIGHDLKQLVTTLAADRGVEMRGIFFDTLVAGYMCNPGAPLADPGGRGRNALRHGAACARRQRRYRRRGGGSGAARGRRGIDHAAHGTEPRAGAGRGRAGRSLRRGRDAARSGPGPHGARGRAARPRGAGGDARGVRRDPGRARVADLRARRARVQHRLTQAARADPLPRARAAGHQADAHRLLDGCIGPGRAA